MSVTTTSPLPTSGLKIVNSSKLKIIGNKFWTVCVYCALFNCIVCPLIKQQPYFLIIFSYYLNFEREQFFSNVIKLWNINLTYLCHMSNSWLSRIERRYLTCVKWNITVWSCGLYPILSPVPFTRYTKLPIIHRMEWHGNHGCSILQIICVMVENKQNLTNK